MLKAFRKAHELDQGPMAKILHMSQANYSRIETSQLELKPSQMQLLVDKFGEKEVNDFCVEGAHATEFVTASNNTNVAGTQNNGVTADKDLIALIKTQVANAQEHMQKYYELSAQLLEQNARQLSLLEKMLVK